VSLHEEDVAVAPEGNIIRLIEEPRSCGFVPNSGLAFGSESKKHLALGAHLHDSVAASVRNPDVAVGIQRNPVRTISE
jgi:hypothetical protein